MGKNNNRKSSRKKTHQKHKQNIIATPVIVPVAEKKLNFFQIFWSKMSLTWKIVGVISVLLTIALTCFQLKDYFKTPYEKYEDDTFLQGQIETPKIKGSVVQPKIKGAIITPYTIADTLPNFQLKPTSATNPKVNGVLIGSYIKKKIINVFVNDFLFQCSLDDLQKGIKLFSTSLSGCTDTNLTIGVKDERLYVSTVFKDIEKEETVGSIEFNHWKLFKPNLLDFRNGEQKLEVKDKQNRIVFSVRFSKDVDAVFISGYFISSKSILILSSPVERTIYDTTVIANFMSEAGITKTDDNSGPIHLANFKKTICISKTDINWKKNAVEYIEQLTSVFD